ncbi:MAG: hypothetical protein R2778_16955 [Saprospiraceae bacterium]
MQKPSQEVTYKQFEYWRENIIATVQYRCCYNFIGHNETSGNQIFEDRLAAEIKTWMMTKKMQIRQA